MPIPEFQNTVTPEPLKKVRPIPGFEEQAPEAAFGGGKGPLAAEAGQLGEDAGKVLQKHIDEANDHATMGLYGQAQEIAAKHVYGPDGLMNKPITDQKQIDETLTAVRNEWDKLQPKNTDQKDMFGKMREKLDGEMVESVYKKASADAIEQGKANADRMVNASTTLATLDFDHAEDRLKEVKAASNTARMGKEQTEPNFNYRVVHAMLDAGQIERAREWKDNPNHYFGAMADKMDKDFENAKKSHDVQEAFHSVIGSSPDLKSALTQVDKIDDAQQQSKVRKLVQGFYTAHTKAMEDKEMQSFLNISNHIGENAGTDPETLTGFSMLSAKHQAELIRQSDPNFQGSMQVAKQWSSLTAQEIKGLSKGDFYDDFYSKLPKEDRKDAETMWKYQQDPQGAKGSYASDSALRNDIRLSLVQAGIVDKGLKPGEWSTNDLTNADNLRIAIKTDIEAYKDAHKGADPDKDTIHKMINDEVSTFYKSGMFGSKTGGFTPIEGVDPKFQKTVLKMYHNVSESQIKELQLLHNTNKVEFNKMLEDLKKQ